MGLSMTMKDQLFSASEVSTANAFGGLFTIPITLMIGALSDKLGRKRFLFMVGGVDIVERLHLVVYLDRHSARETFDVAADHQDDTELA